MKFGSAGLKLFGHAHPEGRSSVLPVSRQRGPIVKVRSLAHALTLRGHQVCVLTADLGLASYDDVDVKIERCSWGWRGLQDCVEVIYLSTAGHYRALTFNPRLLGFCRSYLTEFDLVHFYGLYDLFGPVVSFFCRRHGIPYVIEPMGMNRPIDRNIQLKQVWHRSMGRAFWQSAARIIATSELERDELVEDHVDPRKIVVRHNGVEPRSDKMQSLQGSFRVRHGIPMEDCVILFVSRLIPRKRADVLIRAFSKPARLRASS